MNYKFYLLKVIKTLCDGVGKILLAYIDLPKIKSQTSPGLSR